MQIHRIIIGIISSIALGKNAFAACKSDSDFALAINKNDSVKVESLLRKGSNVNGSDDECRALIFSALEKPTILKLLLDQGASMDVSDEPQGWTPLAWATYYATNDEKSENFKVLELLLSKGADINKPLKNYSLLDIAVTNSRSPTKVKAIQFLLDHKADPNSVACLGKFCHTPLMNAAKSGNIAAVRALIKAKADVNYRKPGGDRSSALQFAEEYKHPEIAKILRDAGAR